MKIFYIGNIIEEVVLRFFISMFLTLLLIFVIYLIISTSLNSLFASWNGNKCFCFVCYFNNAMTIK